MAYREFHVEKHYEAPNLDGFLDQYTQAVTNMFHSMSQNVMQRRKASDQFSYDLNEGKYENDTKILTEVAKNVTDRARQEMRKSGRVSMETDNLMTQGKGWMQMSKNQFDRAKSLNDAIRSKTDPYYNPEPDLSLVQEATHGKDNDIDFRTRGERLTEAEKQLGGVNTFRFDKYRADYVKAQGPQSKEVETPLKNGSSVTKYNQATFWDEERGTPGVTDKHAIRFIDSDRRVAQYYDDRISKELDQEISAMKASGDQRVSWMKDLSNAEIKNELINNPAKNLINKEEYGVRVRNKAKEDLREADRINSKVSYTSLQDDKNNSGGRWSNQNILHDNSINSFAQEAKSESTGKMEAVTTYGPGGRFTQKSGKPIQVDTTNPIRTDINTGVTTRNNKGSLRFNMTGYQLMPVQKGQAPFVLKSGDVNGMIEEINNMPLSYFDPSGKVGLQPEMKVGMNGYTINEAGVLNDVQDQLVNLSSEIAAARKTGNLEEIAKLENMEFSLNELKEMISSGDYDQQDLILAGNKAGVRKVQQNWIIPADDSDVATIKNVTGGFNLKDKSYWSPDMQAVDVAYKRRYEQAVKDGFGKPKAEEGVVASDGNDTDKWVTTSSYKVGNSVYYFDKKEGQWKKR